MANYKFILQNIRSLRKNLDTFLTNINAINLDFDLICFTETWISSGEMSNYSLDGYSFHANCNDQYRSGGVAVFVRSSLIYDVSSVSLSSADIMKIYIQLGNVKVCFILIYRFNFCPFDTFLEQLTTLLNDDKSKHKILLGDINLDLLKDSRTKDDYLLLCSSFGLVSLLNSVTRPCANTCVDHVFSETICKQFSIELKNLNLFVTDHTTIHLTLKLANKAKRGRMYEPVYQTKINYSGLSEALYTSDWSEVFSSFDPNITYAFFIDKFIFNLNKFKTIVKIKRSHFKLKPWMSDSLLKLINHRNRLSKKLAKNRNNDVLKKKVEKLNSKIKILVPLRKERYFKNKIEAATDIKSKWKIVNNVLNNKPSINSITAIDIGVNNIKTDPKEIANVFNDHFINIPNVIINKNHENIIIEDVVRNSMVLSRYSNLNFFFFPISESEILSAVNELKYSNSCGVDGVSNSLVKNVIFSITHILEFIFNLCFEKGVFPEKLKIGIVKPLYKKDSRIDLNNYRPITLLNTFSKIFEKIIKFRLLNYFERIQFLDKRQFGFIKQSSTEKALISFLTPVYHHLNENLKVSSLFIDITKAFDTVNHAILLDKLSHIGIRGSALSLFQSYLQNRVQTVCINKIYSDEKVINVGVPQGSVLGPLLFLIYCNSIFDLKLHGSLVAFADDMAFLYSSSDMNLLKCAVKNDMSLLKKWFYVHDMVLSCKSKIMYFNVSCAIQDPNPIFFHSLACNESDCNTLCVPIENVTSFKYLGVSLDSQLNFKDHIANLKMKLRQTLRTFFYLRNICSSKFLRCLYYALFDSHLQYGITCWGGIYLSNIKPLMTIQKGVLKIMNYLPRTTPSLPLFVHLKILPLRYLYVFKVLKMYYVMSGHRLINFHISEPYMFRNKNRIKTPQPYKEHFKKFFSYTAPKLYTQVPTDIVNANTITKFSRLLKDWLFTISNIEILFETLI